MKNIILKTKNIQTCSNISCLCIEYLNLKKNEHIKLYNYCYKNNLKNKGFFDLTPYTKFYKHYILYNK